MEGVVVGKRRIGTQAPVTVGWENIPRVEGGPFKRLFFTWFQPTVLFALILFFVVGGALLARVDPERGIREAGNTVPSVV